MSETTKALEGFPRIVFVRRKLNEDDDNAVGAVDNGAGYAIGATEMVTQNFTAAESALVKKGMHFFVGSKAVGAANVATLAGAHAITVDGFDADELADMKTGDIVKITTGAVDYYYELLKADSTTLYIKEELAVATVDEDVIEIIDSEPYQINDITLSAGAITGLSFAPGLKTAVADDDIIIIGKGFVKAGMFTADSFNDEQSSSTNMKTSEKGTILGTNSVQDSRKLTLNLVENTDWNLEIWGKRISYVDSNGYKSFYNPQETFVVGSDNAYDVLIVKDDCAGQYFDLQTRMRYPNCQYTPESISINPTAANVSQSWTPILAIIPGECGAREEIIGNPLTA